MKVIFALSASGGFLCTCEIFGIKPKGTCATYLFHSFSPHERENLIAIYADAERRNGD